MVATKAKKKANSGDDEKTSPVQRAFKLLQFLATREGVGARIPEICEALSIHRVNAHRLVKTLCNMGVVEQAPNLSYHLGFETWTLGLAASRHFVSPIINETIARISETTGDSVFVMRRAGNEAFCIAAQEGSLPIRFVNMRVGARRYLGVGGLSTAILSALDPAETAEVIKRNSEHYPTFGLTAKKVEELAKTARKLGYAYSEGVIVPETRTMAVPILASKKHQNSVMSVSILTTESRMREPRRTQLAELLKREVARITTPFGV